MMKQTDNFLLFTIMPFVFLCDTKTRLEKKRYNDNERKQHSKKIIHSKKLKEKQKLQYRNHCVF